MKNQKISVVTTTFKEGKNIELLVLSLVKQLKSKDEILLIDAGSLDGTLDRVKKFKNVRLVVKKGINRAKGRNLGVKLAANEIIAMIDAGCIAKKNWLKNITKPIIEGEAEVVAGFYNMVGKTNLQKCMTVFLGVMPNDFDDKFLPSTRSIAFTRSIWKKTGGFPEGKENNAEDTLFCQKLVKNDVKIKRVKSARVEWAMPQNIFEFAKKIYSYAKWDAQSKVFIERHKLLTSHNIKVIFVYIRYLLALLLLSYGLFINPLAFTAFVIFLILYLIFAFHKALSKTEKVVIAIYGPILQIICDFCVMSGFFVGML